MEETREDDESKGVSAMDVDRSSRSAKLVDLLRRFLGVQQRRAEAYAKLRRYYQGSIYEIPIDSTSKRDRVSLWIIFNSL